MKKDKFPKINRNLSLVGMYDSLRSSLCCRCIRPRPKRFNKNSDALKPELEPIKSNFPAIELMERQMKEVKAPAEIYDIVKGILLMASSA